MGNHGATGVSQNADVLVVLVHLRHIPWLGIQISKILLLGIIIFVWSLGNICEIFIFNHSFVVIFVKI